MLVLSRTPNSFHVREDSRIDFATGNVYARLGGGRVFYTKTVLTLWQQSNFQAEKLKEKMCQ